MKHFILLLLLFCNSLFCAAQSNNELPYVVKPAIELSLYQQCLFSIIKHYKIKTARDVNEHELLKNLPKPWQNDLKRTISLFKLAFQIYAPGVRKIWAPGSIYRHQKPIRDRSAHNLMLLLQRGANPNPLIRDYQRYNNEKISPLLHLIREQFFNLADAALDAGADASIPSGNWNLTPLHKLCETRIYEQEEGFNLILKILKSDSTPNHQDIHGDTPLHYLAKSVFYRGALTNPYNIPLLVSELKQAGADHTIKNNKEQTPGQIFAEAKELFHDSEELNEALDNALALLDEVPSQNPLSSCMIQ